MGWWAILAFPRFRGLLVKSFAAARPLRRTAYEGYWGSRMWIAAGVASILIVVGATLALLRNRGTLYVFRNTAFSTQGGSRSHRTSSDGLQTAVQRLLPGDVFDMLWVSAQEDEYGGLILTVESGVPVLSVDFKTHAEQAQREAFKKAMASRSFDGTEDSNGFNGGFREEFRVTTLEYPLFLSPEKIVDAIKFALTLLDPNAGDEYFVKASTLREIVRSRPGIKLVPDSDPLSDL